MKVILTKKAPQPAGHYSQAIVYEPLLDSSSFNLIR